jgi:hypothetical protein
MSQGVYLDIRIEERDLGRSKCSDNLFHPLSSADLELSQVTIKLYHDVSSSNNPKAKFELKLTLW